MYLGDWGKTYCVTKIWGKMHFLHTCSNMSETKICMEIRVDFNEDLQPESFTFMIHSDKMRYIFIA